MWRVTDDGATPSAYATANIRIGSHDIRLLGLLHPPADATKFMWKEDFIPPKADRLLHALGPLIALAPAIAAFAVLPFGDTLYPGHLLGVLPNRPTSLGVPLQIASLDFGTSCTCSRWVAWASSARRWRATRATTNIRCSAGCARPVRWSAKRSRLDCHWSRASCCTARCGTKAW